MNSISNNMSSYLHTYEAYRIPKGTKVQNAAGDEVVLSDKEDTLVLTAESSKQLVKDRGQYGSMLQAKAENAALKTQDEAMRQYNENQAKAISVFRSMSKGDNVPATDENKLMAYDPKLYHAAKMAQAMAQMAKKKAESKKSEWDEREEMEKQAKLDKLCEESNEAALAVATGSHEFGEAQKQNIVEIDSSGIDFSSIKTMNLGGVTGEFIDLSL